MSAAPELLPLRFRTMRYADLKAVMALEIRAYAFPWTETIFQDCIRVGYYCQVLEIQEHMEAYGIMSVGAGEAHVLNLCVQPESQGRGFARRMLEHLLNLASADAVQTVFLEVRPSNLRALELYRSAGFCEVGIRRGYYPNHGGREDALVMAKAL
jgi:ribosomal-protein-alanine N-acetyltransferase